MATYQTRLRTAACTCGQVAFETSGEPIVTATCYCTSCQTAGQRLEARPSAPPLLDADGGTPFVLFRKDRIRCLRGQAHLREHRLAPTSKTRRVIASCCNTPMFLEFSGGHWLSIYKDRFPKAEQPALEMRTMTRDRRPAVAFTDGLPSYKTHSGRFMWKLLTAWAAMGFRAPKINYVNGTIDP
ncbi:MULTISPECIES: hypothetical protein [unclassified Beijerinckia]|uniref:GFA family protein n=1 Tax=unclassified Beijerinckia TaxID=2638183 RepID=UPI00089D2CAE|nr:MULTISPECIES: hypothetical protein [unclassified Beijerinckia]MDH7795581.1 hypothetical protein [Beijerinckia sp. GAS462]SEC07576.1 Uncharacterized conserved protein [Beijerinckia sp. 28-YEA-48]